MVRDEYILLGLIGFAVFLACFGIAFGRLSQRVRSFRCPQCGENLAVTEIRAEGIHCHHCDWTVERQSSDAGADSGEVRP